MKDWPAEDANVLASDSDDANEGAGVESAPESCCVRESGREEEDERQIYLSRKYPLHNACRTSPNSVHSW